MKTLKEYPIYKKRDGQDWKHVGYITACTFWAAKKTFATFMTKDNWEKSNNIVWIDKSEGVKESGWYDLNASILRGNEDQEVDYSISQMELFCSEKAINKGFAYWNEDVYSWELRKNK